MFGWMVLALVALLAAPVLSVIALVLAIGDSALLRQLNERLKVLERGQAAKSAPAPGPTPQPTPQSAPAPTPAPIVAAPVETPAAANVSPGFIFTACPIVGAKDRP